MMVPMNAATLEKKRVLLRLDLNVPLSGGKIDESENHKIMRVLPTIDYLIEHGAKIRIMTHLGRPKGKIDKSLSLFPVAKYLSDISGQPVNFVEDYLDTKNQEKINEIDGIVMFENLRFHPGEESNDSVFANALADLGDIYINDAFAVSHKKHASIVGVTKYLPSFAGFLLCEEIDVLSDVMENPDRPLVVIIGGAKISTKIKLIKRFLGFADHLILGGALANTVLQARGINIGSSLTEKKMIEKVKNLDLKNTKLHIPIDVTVPELLGVSILVETKAVNNIGGTDKILDIGPDTCYLYSGIISESETVIWNGPMGLAEYEEFSRGTRKIAEATRRNTKAFSIVGGGDTVAIIRKMNLLDGFDYVSTGGGAMLEYLAGDKLPGIEALPINPVRPKY